ncbi:phage protein GemA/Gp16 family protein [Dysosmobacter sp.]
MEETAAMITTAQIKKIWAEAKIAGLSDQALHKTFIEVFNKFSMKQLTKAEASEVINGLCIVNGSACPTAPQRSGMMTYPQQRYIEGMQRDLGWSNEQLTRMVKRVCKVDHFLFVDKSGAAKLIEAMKNMLQKKQKEEARNVQ